MALMQVSESQQSLDVHFLDVCASGDVRGARLLLEKNPKILWSCQDGTMLEAMHEAATAGNADMLSGLLSMCAEYDNDFDVYTMGADLLADAVMKGHLDVVDIMLHHCKEPLVVDTHADHMTAPFIRIMQLCCVQGSGEVMQMLVDCFVDNRPALPLPRARALRPVFETAARCGAPAVFPPLCRALGRGCATAGVEYTQSVQDIMDESLQCAAQSGCTPVIDALYAMSKLEGVSDDDARVPRPQVHACEHAAYRVAARNGHAECITTLLRHAGPHSLPTDMARALRCMPLLLEAVWQSRSAMLLRRAEWRTERTPRGKEHALRRTKRMRDIADAATESPPSEVPPAAKWPRVQGRKLPW